MAARSRVPGDGRASVLPSLGKPRPAGGHLPVARGVCSGDLWRVWSDCSYVNLGISLWLCQGTEILNFASFSKMCARLFFLLQILWRPFVYNHFYFDNWITKAVETWMWFWCCVIVFDAFAATCSENTEFDALQEIPVLFLLSPSTLFLCQCIILHILEISNFRVIISFLDISPR